MQEKKSEKTEDEISDSYKLLFAKKVMSIIKKMESSDYSGNIGVLTSSFYEYRNGIRVPLKFRRAFSREELTALIWRATATYRPIWLCLASTGLRLEELSYLRWADIDFERREIRVSARPGWRPKTKAGERSIPMTDALLDEMRGIQRRGEYVFATNDGKRRRWNVRRELGRQVRAILPELHPDWNACRVDEEVAQLDVHAIRYTFATRLVATGADPKTVQRIMGHADIKTTLSIYAQYADGGAELAISRLDILGSGANLAQPESITELKQLI